MRHDPRVGQASDEASGSVGQAGAGNHDDKSKPRAAATKGRPMSSSGQSRSPTPTLAAIIVMTAQADGLPVGVVSGRRLLIIDRDRSAQNEPAHQAEKRCRSTLFDQHLDRGAHGLNA